MKIQFCGAVRTVTGSQHIIEVNGKRILLECGLYQGKRSEYFEKNQHLPFDAKSIDLCILSHAHIDHSGNLPNLVKSGFKGDILCTYATRDLCTIMLRDSAAIQTQDVEYLNKERKNRQLPPLDPIYTMEDTIECLKSFLSLAYDRPREILPGVTLTFLDAGHILGSAIVCLDIDDKEAKKSVKLVFSGDLGRTNRPILRDPSPVKEADILFIESTYGDRVHENQEAASRKLEQVINETVKKNGKVIIPSFAVGRTQEIVYALKKLVEANKISRNLPVYVDSPLAVDATGIYRLHPEAFDEETYNMLLTGRNGDPFGFEMMHYVRTVNESKALNNLAGPAIIISASGMAEAGRVLHHLKNNIEDPGNTVLFVGWQAPNTLGRRLIDKTSVVNILGNEYKLKARVEKINGYSAHADKEEMMKWLSYMKNPPAQTFIVHGEENVSLAFAEMLKAEGFPSVSVPELGQTVSV